jgi:fatty-acyl-CoA synthase
VSAAAGAAVVLPANSTLALIAASAAAHPDRPALLHQLSAGDPEAVLVWRYREFYQAILKAAALLRAHGVTRDSRVAILAPNIPATHVALWAAELAGIAFPVNYLLGAAHIAELFQAADVSAAIVLSAHPSLPIFDTLTNAIGLSGKSITVFEIDPNEASPATGSLQQRWQGCAPAAELLFEITPSTSAALFHTGGTTSAPKILRHIHRNQMHVAEQAPGYYALAPGDVMLNGFPLFHVAGAFVYGLSALAVGATLYIPTMLAFRDPQFVEQAWALLAHHRVSHLGCVPTTIATLLQKYDQFEAPRTLVARRILTGGSPLPAQLADAMEQKTGIPVRNIFGMTECAGVVSVEPADRPRVAGSVGFALPGSRVRAVALDSDLDASLSFCAAGETGVLCLQGPHVSPGYLDARLDLGTFTKEGWLVSGDLGHVEADGRIFLTGRAKDLIIRSGHNLDPQAIEEAFMGHESVAVCAAVGRLDSYAGEVPVVFVTLKEGFDLSGDDILNAVRARIAEPPAVPKAVIVIDSMPLTAVGKIHKPTLRELANRPAPI